MHHWRICYCFLKGLCVVSNSRCELTAGRFRLGQRWHVIVQQGILFPSCHNSSSLENIFHLFPQLCEWTNMFRRHGNCMHPRWTKLPPYIILIDTEMFAEGIQRLESSGKVAEPVDFSLFTSVSWNLKKRYRPPRVSSRFPLLFYSTVCLNISLCLF